MNSILDQVIANSGSARIVSENHNPDGINWVAGLTDPGEMIRCGYLPEIRRKEGEQDGKYLKRITPIVMALPLKGRERIMQGAKKRASLDTSNGRVNVMVAGKAPWHGLGVNVEEATTSTEAIKLAGMDWSVEKLPLSYEFNGQRLESPDVFAIVRKDTGKALGNVGRVYKPIQNQDGFDFLDSVLAQHGARYETAGSLYDGHKVWMLAKLPNHAFEVSKGDKVECFALFTNAHDSSEAGYCFPTTERVVCANTYRTAGHGKHKGIRIRHTGNIKNKIADAQTALGIAVESFSTFKDASVEMTHKPVEITHFADDVLDAVLEVTKADMLAGVDKLLEAVICKTEAEREFARNSIERKLERREEILEDILNRYESERCGKGDMRGTTWAAFNAVTEHADHAKVGKQSRDLELRASRRFESVMTGPADEMKQAAFQVAMRTN